MKSNNTFTLLKPLEFLDDVVSHASRAKRRFFAQAMEVEPGKHTDRLLTSLAEAGERGIDTRLHADWYSLLVTDGVFNYWPLVSPSFRRNRKGRLKKKKSAYAKLKEKGVTVTLTNAPTFLDRLFPMRGRNHMKMVIIDDTAWIGGVNFHDQNFLCEDVMVRITDPAITHEIAYIFALVEDNRLQRDMKITCTETTSLLIDSGRINHSLILRNACELIQKASESVFWVSLLFPDADMLKALEICLKKKRTVEIISPEISRMAGMYALVDYLNHLILVAKRIKLPLLMKNFGIHTKMLIIDETQVMIGSHNLSKRGVRMGTEEIALLTSDPSLLGEVLKYKQQLLTKTSL